MGEEKDASFCGRELGRVEDDACKEQMRNHSFYRMYPAEGVKNLGAWGGYFSNLQIRCGLAFDVKGDIDPLCSINLPDGLFVWNKNVVSKLKKKEWQGHWRNYGDASRNEEDGCVCEWVTLIFCV